MKLEPVELDLQGMRDNLLRKGTPKRVYYFEHAESDEIKDELVKRFDLAKDITIPQGTPEFAWQKEINIQRFLGHSSASTTSIYLHITGKDLAKIKSPIDHIEDDQKSDP